MSNQSLPSSLLFSFRQNEELSIQLFSFEVPEKSESKKMGEDEEVVLNFQSRSSLSLSFMRLSMDHNTAAMVPLPQYVREVAEQSLVHHYF